MARRKHYSKSGKKKSKGIGALKFNKQSIMTLVALGFGALIARYANKKLPDLIGSYSSSLGTFAGYATPAAIVALAYVVRKMAKGGQFVTLATNQAIGDAIADAFAQAFPNVITGLGMDQPLQALPYGEDFYRIGQAGRATPYPSALQGIPETVNVIRERGDFQQLAY